MNSNSWTLIGTGTNSFTFKGALCIHLTSYKLNINVEALVVIALSAYDEHRATTTNGEKEKKIKEEETLEFFFDNAIVFYSLFTSSSSSFVFLKGEMSILSDRTC